MVYKVYGSAGYEYEVEAEDEEEAVHKVLDLFRSILRYTRLEDVLDWIATPKNNKEGIPQLTQMDLVLCNKNLNSIFGSKYHINQEGEIEVKDGFVAGIDLQRMMNDGLGIYLDHGKLKVSGLV